MLQHAQCHVKKLSMATELLEDPIHVLFLNKSVIHKNQYSFKKPCLDSEDEFLKSAAADTHKFRILIKHKHIPLRLACHSIHILTHLGRINPQRLAVEDFLK